MMPETAIDPAFPGSITAADGRLLGGSMGMTLLDYFAAAALTGLLSQHRGRPGETAMAGVDPAYPGWDPREHDQLADDAYDIAIQMVLMRERRFLDRADDEA